METDPAKRPSRRGWPLRTQATTTSAGTHDHKLPQGIFRVLIAVCVFLVVLAVVDAFLVLYITGRGQLREQQIEQVREQIRESWCQALDGLPRDNAYLDILRDKYDCGPGLPLSQFSPDVQKQLSPGPSQPSTPPVQQPPPTSSATPEPPPAAPVSPVQPPAPDAPAPPPGGADGPMQPSEPPPLSPPSQIRELVCGLLPVCPEG